MTVTLEELRELTDHRFEFIGRCDDGTVTFAGQTAPPPISAVPDPDPSQAEPGKPDMDPAEQVPVPESPQAEPEASSANVAEPAGEGASADDQTVLPSVDPAVPAPPQAAGQTSPQQQSGQPVASGIIPVLGGYGTQAGPYFVSGQFMRDIAGFKASAGLMTGYRPLDRIQPLYPGLYGIGAISSLGKTTFNAQMANQIAASGRYVLYFSLGQTAFELFSKSIARGYFRTNRADTKQNNKTSTYPKPSSIDIRRGMYGSQADLDRQSDVYVQDVLGRVIV